MYMYVHVQYYCFVVHTRELQGRQSGKSLAIERFLSPSSGSQDQTALPKNS